MDTARAAIDLGSDVLTALGIAQTEKRCSGHHIRPDHPRPVQCRGLGSVATRMAGIIVEVRVLGADVGDELLGCFASDFRPLSEFGPLPATP